MAIDEAESSNSEAKRREKEAHILNIHEDVVLSRAICYFFPRDEVTTFGNRNRFDASPPGGTTRKRSCSHFAAYNTHVGHICLFCYSRI
jgi:hypothetical protein